MQPDRGASAVSVSPRAKQTPGSHGAHGFMQLRMGMRGSPLCLPSQPLASPSYFPSGICQTLTGIPVFLAAGIRQGREVA